MTGPIVVAIAADTKEFAKGEAEVKSGLGGIGDAAQQEGGRVSTAFAAMGESADGVSSASAQAAGGLGDLGGALSLLPGPLGGLGAGMEATAPAIMGLTGASDLLNLATTKFPGLAKVASAGAKGLGLAMEVATGPIGLIVLGLAAAAAALIYAYNHSEKFRAIVNAAFDSVKIAVAAVAGSFEDVWTNVSKWLGKAWDYIQDLPGKIKGAFSGIWDGIGNGLKAAVNAVLHLPLTIPVIDTHIPGVGKVGGQTLIPALASGGIVTAPTLALIGEAGPEAVVPLSRYNSGPQLVRVDINLTADAIDDLERGRTYQARIDAFQGSGGKPRAA